MEPLLLLLPKDVIDPIIWLLWLKTKAFNAHSNFDSLACNWGQIIIFMRKLGQNPIIDY